MLESPAFRVLWLREHRFLYRLEIEHLRHAGRENGQLIVTYDDFVRWGIRRNDITATQRALEALGFIEVTARGQGGPLKRPNRYRLTYENVVGNRTYAEATHEWQLIKTLEEAEARAAEARQSPVAGSRPYRKNSGPLEVYSTSIREVDSTAPSPAPLAYTPPSLREVDSYLYYGRGGRSGDGGGRRKRRRPGPSASASDVTPLVNGGSHGRPR
jgi:hypothetical protein